MCGYGVGRNSMTNVFHRFPKRRLPVAAGGEGPYIIDSEGKRYLDASGGAAVSSLGHGNDKVKATLTAQIDQLPFAHTSFFTSAPAEELADFLAQAAPGDLNKVYFLSSGSEAVEAALKLARQYHVERGEGSRTRIISRLQSYHGNTLGALAAGGNIMWREKFAPLLVDVGHISPCYEYRGRLADETAAEYGLRVADELEEAILKAGPENVMCFIAETVGGATLGAVPPVEGYFARIREICDKYGVLLILDEVMSGMGRTGTLFAFEQENIVPDIVVLAKGLGAGYQPIGAMIASDRIFDMVVDGSGFFQHGHTYTGHIAACSAALAVQRYIRDEGLLENVRRRGEELMAGLREEFADHPHVGDIRGRGLFQALEFVSDRKTKDPLDPRRQFSSRLKSISQENGLITYPMGGLIDGVAGDHVLLAPPFIIETSHIREIIEKLQISIDMALNGTE